MEEDKGGALGRDRCRAEAGKAGDPAISFSGRLCISGTYVSGKGLIKRQPSNARDLRDMGSIPRSGRPPEGGHSNPLKYSCLENPHGQRSLVDCGP